MSENFYFGMYFLIGFITLAWNIRPLQEKAIKYKNLYTYPDNIGVDDNYLVCHGSKYLFAWPLAYVWEFTSFCRNKYSPTE